MRCSECAEIDLRDGLAECVLVCGRVRSEGGKQVRGGDDLGGDVVRVGAVRREGDAHLCAAEVLVVDGGQKLYGDEDRLAGLCVVEEWNLFEVFAECDAASVEVDDLGHRTVGRRDELKADVDAGEVVAVQGFGDGDALAIPDGFLAGFRANLRDGPGVIVECGRLSVRDDRLRARANRRQAAC